MLPLLRLSSSHPRVVNVSSEVGLALSAVAFNAPYSISKWAGEAAPGSLEVLLLLLMASAAMAVEAYSFSLRQELALLQPSPVQVVTLTPGAFTTELSHGATQGCFQGHADRPGGHFQGALQKAQQVTRG